MTTDDKVLWDLITTLKNGRPMGMHGSYIQNFEIILHTSDKLLFLDKKLMVQAAIRGAFNSMLHESHPRQFGMKFLAEYIWWPKIYREIYHHVKSCRQCVKAGKNVKVLLGPDHTCKFPDWLFADEEINLDFARPLDAFCGTKKYILLCIDCSTKFPPKTSSNSVNSFLNDYCQFHGFPRKIRVNH